MVTTAVCVFRLFVFFCSDDVNQHKRGEPKQQNASKSAAETAAVAVDSLILRFHLSLLPLQ